MKVVFNFFQLFSVVPVSPWRRVHSDLAPSPALSLPAAGSSPGPAHGPAADTAPPRPGQTIVRTKVPT